MKQKGNNKRDLSHIPYLRNNYSTITNEGFEAKDPFLSLSKKNYIEFKPDDVRKNRSFITKKKELMNESQIVVKFFK